MAALSDLHCARLHAGGQRSLYGGLVSYSQISGRDCRPGTWCPARRPSIGQTLRYRDHRVTCSAYKHACVSRFASLSLLCCSRPLAARVRHSRTGTRALRSRSRTLSGCSSLPFTPLQVRDSPCIQWPGTCRLSSSQCRRCSGQVRELVVGSALSAQPACSPSDDLWTLCSVLGVLLIKTKPTAVVWLPSGPAWHGLNQQSSLSARRAACLPQGPVLAVVVCNGGLLLVLEGVCPASTASRLPAPAWP